MVYASICLTIICTENSWAYTPISTHQFSPYFAPIWSTAELYMRKSTDSHTWFRGLEFIATLFLELLLAKAKARARLMCVIGPSCIYLNMRIICDFLFLCNCAEISHVNSHYAESDETILSVWVRSENKVCHDATYSGDFLRRRFPSIV